MFAEVLGRAMPDDGVTFDVDALEVGPIRDDQEYGGVRFATIARILYRFDATFLEVVTVRDEPPPPIDGE